MSYGFTAIPDSQIPRASSPIFQHLLDTYASETNKVITVWRCFNNADLSWRPRAPSQPVIEVFKHQLLSERRFFGEFLSAPEPGAKEVLPAEATVSAYTRRMQELAEPRLAFLAARTEPWWLEVVPFFDVRRQRIWIFWRRVLHTVPPPHAAERVSAAAESARPAYVWPDGGRKLARGRPDAKRRGGGTKVSAAPKGALRFFR